MRIQLAIAALIFPMVQAVLFGIGVVAVLASPLTANAQTFIPLVIGVSVPLSMLISWLMAPRLRKRFAARTI